MKDEHTHCPCNGVYLCRTCHEWAHANPFVARADGYVIPRNVRDPYNQPIYTYYEASRVLFRCNGRVVLNLDREEQPDGA